MSIKNLINIHSSYEIDAMRRAGKEAARLLRLLGEMVKPGIRTIELDNAAVSISKERGFRNGPLGYLGGGLVPFPKSICTSVNDVICHGIPGGYSLKEGDLINIDVSPVLDGWYGDTSATFCVGQVAEENLRLVDCTKRALDAGINAAKPGANLFEIGDAIEKVAQKEKFSVVREFTGHGLGRIFHGAPTIYHWKNEHYNFQLLPGMIFTIEPMINYGAAGGYLMPDKWTAKTKDGKASAQFEHSILITETGSEILTKE